MPAALGMRVIGRLLPGVRRVHEQVEPFAQAWRAANDEALARSGPLWVALGDSLTQGIGARDIEGGWVGQLSARLDRVGRRLRVVNLSVTGARIRSVVDDQVPRLLGLGVEPALLTVLVGANDMVLPGRREAAVEDFARLLKSLPTATIVIGTLPRRNRSALAINAQIEAAAAAGAVGIAELRGRTLGSLRGTRSEDHFHPNELGHRWIADAFAKAVGLQG